MRRFGAAWLVAAMLLTASSAAAAAPGPREILNDVYAKIYADQVNPQPRYTPPAALYSPRLKHLMAAARRAAHGEAPCGLDFVFWVNAQDMDLSDIVIKPGPRPSDMDHRTFFVSFTNIRQHDRLVFSFKRIGGHWLIDDVTSDGEGATWTLSRLLQCKD